MSLRYLSAKCAASSLNLTKADVLRLPVDVHDDLRLHLSKEKQIELWDGEYKLWWHKGKLSEHSWWKNGVREGEYKSWWSNGQLQIHCWYKNGVWDGEYKRWRMDGQLWRHCWYMGSILIKEIL